MLVFRARLTHAGKVALDVGNKTRHAHVGKRFRQYLQRDRFTGTRRTRDQTVAVCHRRFEINGILPCCKPDFMLILDIHGDSSAVHFDIFNYITADTKWQEI